MIPSTSTGLTVVTSNGASAAANGPAPTSWAVENNEPDGENEIGSVKNSRRVNASSVHSSGEFAGASGLFPASGLSRSLTTEMRLATRAGSGAVTPSAKEDNTESVSSAELKTDRSGPTTGASAAAEVLSRAALGPVPPAIVMTPAASINADDERSNTDLSGPSS